MEKVRTNQLIECMSYIACVLICFIHVPFPKPFSSYVILAGRAAVPFFLLLSGYFACCDDPVRKAKKKLRDTVRIVLTAGAVCFLWNCINCFLQNQNLFQWTEPYTGINTLWNFLLYNRATFLNSVFYYFFMLIYVYIVYIISCRCNCVKYMYPLIPVLIVLLFVRATNGEWYEGGNWLFTGIPFFYLGHYMHAHSRIITAMKGKEIILILLGYGIAYLEKTMQWHTPYIYAGSIITAAAVLCLCMNYSEISCPSFLVKLGTQCSLPVLLFHCQIRDTLQLFLAKDTYWFPPLVVIATTVLVFTCRAVMNMRKTVQNP